MKIKKKDVVQLHNAIEELYSVKGAKKFAYALTRNKPVVHTVFLELRKQATAPQEWYTYERERLALLNEMAERDAQKKIITNENGEVKIPDDKTAEFEEKYKVLNEKYKDTITNYQEHMKSMEASLEDEIDIDIHQIDFDSVPDEVSAQHLDALKVMINQKEQNGGSKRK